jgi:putative nucleotidyltransferase with HDIG domain
MSTPVFFLNALAQALSTLNLYTPGHPVRARAVAACHARLRELQTGDATPLFSFLGDDVIYGTQSLHEMRQWQWAARLSAAGVQRLEFTGRVTEAQLEEVLDHLLARLGGAGEGDVGSGTVRFGAVGLREDAARPEADGQPARPAVPELGYPLVEEVTAMRHLLAGAARDGVVDGDTARAIARSLVAVRPRDGGKVIPIVRLASFDEYLVSHALNVASLGAALAEALGMGRGAVQAAAVAGLLHDVGMTRVPREVTGKNQLTPEERRLVEDHVRVGARMILQTAPALEVAAIVAYEHHLRPDGRGYPVLGRARTPHPHGQLVRICSVYHALTASRFHWPAWDRDRALTYLEGRAGEEYDAEMVRVFAALIRAPQTCLLPVEELSAAA